MKKCFRCEEEKSEDLFYTFKKEGKFRSHGECIMCANARTAARATNLKMKAIKYLGGSCKICGYNKNPKAMEFHHSDPTQKDYGISTKKERSFEKMKVELDKCILLCANCHREKHDEIFRESNSINWKVFNELVSLEEWPDLKSNTYEQRKPSKYCLNCKIKIGKNCERCKKCQDIFQERIKWPTDEELTKLVWKTPRSQLAILFGVSDKAIAKRCVKRNITQPPRGYWSGK